MRGRVGGDGDAEFGVGMVFAVLWFVVGVYGGG